MARNTLEYTSGGRICLALSSNRILIAQKISRMVWCLVAQVSLEPQGRKLKLFLNLKTDFN